MEIIALAISILSFMLSLFLAVRSVTHEQERFDVDVIDYRLFDTNVALFFVCITNRSERPLTITKIEYDQVICQLEPTVIQGKPGQFLYRESPCFPLHIPPTGAQYFYLVFPNKGVVHDPLSLGKVVTFQIQTTRHQVHKTPVVSHTGFYLHRDSQSQP